MKIWEDKDEVYIQLDDKTMDEIMIHAQAMIRKYPSRNIENTIIGRRGEIGVCYYLNLEPRGIIPKSGDGGIDNIYRHWTWDVKTRNGFDAEHLIINVGKFKTDIAILVQTALDNDLINICGWILKEDFAKHKEMKNFNRGFRECIHKDQLQPIHSLKNIEDRERGKTWKA